MSSTDNEHHEDQHILQKVHILHGKNSCMVTININLNRKNEKLPLVMINVKCYPLMFASFLKNKENIF